MKTNYETLARLQMKAIVISLNSGLISEKRVSFSPIIVIRRVFVLYGFAPYSISLTFNYNDSEHEALLSDIHQVV